MSSQRYERVATIDNDDHFTNSDSPISATQPHSDYPIPASPPPSFRSRASSPTSRRLLSDDPLQPESQRELADAFDSNDEDEDDDDDRQRLMRAQPPEPAPESSETTAPPRQGIQRRVTQLPIFAPSNAQNGRVYGGGRDAVFANMSAKPGAGEEAEEKPPSYEQAAADSAPPYWETTILAPGMSSTDVFIDGLPVGSIFSFVWNAMISVSFQFVGFLLTYLLHTTHAAKNGSRAGLGITLINIGFGMKGASSVIDPSNPSAGGDMGMPSDPNSHEFDPDAVAGVVDGAGDGGLSSSDWMAYILMIVGWFILIRSISDFLRARRHEQLVLQSPDRGLGVPVIAEGEAPATVV